MKQSGFDTKAIFPMVAVMMLLNCITSFSRDFSGYTGLSDEELKGKVWILGGKGAMEERKATVEISGNSYSERMPDRTDFFVLHGDSLLWSGYHVGRRIGLIAVSPVFLCDFHQLNVSSVTSPYHAAGHMDVSTVIEEHGAMEWANMGNGALVLASGDTIRNVTLTRHITRIYVQATDSVDTTEVHESVCYRWYTQGASTPVAIQYGDELFVEDNSAELSGNEDCDNEIERLIRLLECATVDFGSDQVNVTIPEESELYIYIMDVSGNTYGSVRGRGSEFSLSTAGLPSGQFILSVIPVPYTELAKKILFIK